MTQISLTDFIFSLRKQLKKPLPGTQAHKSMRVLPLEDPIPRYDAYNATPRIGAVLIVFSQKEGNILFPLIKRTTYAGVHSGQIGLPGGKSEPKESAIDTALREAKEEINLSPDIVTTIGTLTNFHVIPSNFMITPVVGYISQEPQYKPDQKEVHSILMGNIHSLIHPKVKQEKKIVVQNKYHVLAPYFEIEREMVWGATAMMLNELRWVIHKACPQLAVSD